MSQEETTLQEDPIESLEKKIKAHKSQFRRRVAIIAGITLLLVGGVYLVLKYQTFEKIRVVQTYESESAGNNNYADFLNGILKYSRDGITLLDKKGVEQWKQPYQIKNPTVMTQGDAAVVADSGGNKIMVFEKEGLKGEIETILPIEKVAVSGQGIVSVILKDGVTPRVIAYDATGNVLVEHKVSAKTVGYPISVSISEDGYLLLVTYLKMDESKVSTNVAFYNFDDVGKEKADNQVLAEAYTDVVIPSTFFMNATTAAAVGDNEFIIYVGKETPKKAVRVKLKKEVKSVFYTEKYIGFLLKEKAGKEQELRLYNIEGKEVMSQKVTGEYSHVKMVGNQIMMYDGMRCSIYTSEGVNRFTGEVEKNILGMIPITGGNKYLIMNTSGMEEIRLVK